MTARLPTVRELDRAMWQETDVRGTVHVALATVGPWRCRRTIHFDYVSYEVQRDNGWTEIKIP